MPVAAFFSVTVAPGTTAPEESLTVPSTVAVSNWARADAGSSSAAAIDGQERATQTGRQRRKHGWVPLC